MCSVVTSCDKGNVRHFYETGHIITERIINELEFFKKYGYILNKLMNEYERTFNLCIFEICFYELV